MPRPIGTVEPGKTFFAKDSPLCERCRDLKDVLAELLDQLDGIGIPDWHGAEGLDLTSDRTILNEEKP